MVQTKGYVDDFMGATRAVGVMVRSRGECLRLMPKCGPWPPWGQGLFFHSNRREGAVRGLDVSGRLHVQVDMLVNSLWIASVFSKKEQQKSSAEREVWGEGPGILPVGVK